MFEALRAQCDLASAALALVGPLTFALRQRVFLNDLFDWRGGLGGNAFDLVFPCTGPFLPAVKDGGFGRFGVQRCSVLDGAQAVAAAAADGLESAMR